MNPPQILTGTPASPGSDDVSKLTPLIAGNWKMNGLKAAIDVARAIARDSHNPKVNVALFPPFTLLGLMDQAIGDSAVWLGGQDCHTHEQGAYTGDVSAAMLADIGAKMVILGHSERRQAHGESSHTISLKVRAALKAGLVPIICIGETLKERETGQTEAILLSQLKDSLPDDLEQAKFHIAYEPVWAIGTGLVANDEQIVQATGLIRGALSHRFKTGPVPNILYGGSVNADNAASVLKLEGIGGALVGGASLKAETFLKIIEGAA